MLLDELVHDPSIVSVIIVASPCGHMLEARLSVQHHCRGIGSVDLEDGKTSLAIATQHAHCIGERCPAQCEGCLCC